MDKKLVGLVGAISALIPVGAAQALPSGTPPVQARSFADLLAPIPDAVEKLKASDAGLTQSDQKAAKVELVHHHHHHHHHHFRHHHHHHHHHRF